MMRRLPNVSVLPGCVNRFLLTKHDPAMRMAMDLRKQASAEPEQAADVAGDTRRIEALAVLSDHPSN
jgi:hypothetical protein